MPSRSTRQLSNTRRLSNKNFISTFIISSLLLVPITLTAAPEDDFNTAKKYFHNKQYSEAVEYFHKAKSTGLNNAALNYNLGVSYFKLEKYSQAELYFKETLKFRDMKHLAEYNLGLIALNKQDQDDAQKWFELAKNSNNKKIATMADQQLKKLHKDTGLTWYTDIDLTYGYNSNIEQADEDSASQISDSYIEVYAMTDTMLSGNIDNGIKFAATFSHLIYNDVPATLDETETFLKLGIYKETEFNNWATRFGTYYTRTHYESASYQQKLGLEASGEYSLNNEDSLQLRYRYDNIDSLDSRYNYLEGNRQQFRAGFKKYTTTNSFKLYYQVELNDRKDTASRSYSPTRHMLNGYYKTKLTEKIKLKLSASYRFSDYPETTGFNREDDRYRGAIDLRYKIDKQWQVKGKFERTDNRSTINTYQYTQDVYTMTATYSF